MMAPDPNRWGRKPPREIDAERFHEMLNVLPPCRWQGGDGEESFYVSERLSENIVSHFVRIGERCFQVDQDATMTRAALFHMVREHMAERTETGPEPEPLSILRDRYDTYTMNARALGWPLKTFDEWLNS